MYLLQRQGAAWVDTCLRRCERKGERVLSGEEHRRLREIDEQLTRQDPQLAQRLSSCVAQGRSGRQRVARWRRLLLASAVLCGVALIVAGALAHRRVILAIGVYLVMAAASRALSVLRP